MQLVALARYEPAPHTEHSAAFSPVLYSLAPSQLVQVRSVAASGAFETRVPAAQVRHAVQTRRAVADPADDANLPSAHVG